MIKIIAGEFRSRQLRSPDDDSVSRPYSNRVKESLFNLLRGWFEDATVIDLFAGVGTVGLEAVSRGAKRVYMVERDRGIHDAMKQNIAMLKCEDRATAVLADVLSVTWMSRAPHPADVIFVDPPYELMEDERTRSLVLEMVAKTRTLMGERGFVVLRSPMGSDKADFRIAGFAGPEEHRYSTEMRVLLYSPAAQSPAMGADQASIAENSI
jgi:16S rRNA (guanine(966)-N(2))-methyltransferase RsmD